MSALRTNAWRRAVALLERHKSAAVLAVVIALTSSGTAAAVSYVVLGGINQTSATTILRSDVVGPVLQVTNFDTTGGVSAKGMSINVPAGRAPITVNWTAGKATNLNADKLDGSDAAAFARGTNVTVLANRLVLGNGDTHVNLLTLPGLGTLFAYCVAGLGDAADIFWHNTTARAIDLWNDNSGPLTAFILAPDSARNVAYGVPGGRQYGTVLQLGYGYPPGARATASVTLNAYRTAAGAPCGFQATATIWSAP